MFSADSEPGTACGAPPESRWIRTGPLPSPSRVYAMRSEVGDQAGDSAVWPAGVSAVIAAPS